MKLILKNSSLIFEKIGPHDIQTSFLEGTNISKVVPPITGSYVGGKNFAALSDDVGDTVGGVTYSVSNGVVTLNGQSDGTIIYLNVKSGGITIPNGIFSSKFEVLEGTNSANFTTIRLQSDKYGTFLISGLVSGGRENGFVSGLNRRNAGEGMYLALYPTNGQIFANFSFRILVSLATEETTFNNDLPTFITTTTNRTLRQYTCVQSLDDSTVTIE